MVILHETCDLLTTKSWLLVSQSHNFRDPGRYSSGVEGEKDRKCLQTDETESLSVQCQSIIVAVATRTLLLPSSEHEATTNADGHTNRQIHKQANKRDSGWNVGFNFMMSRTNP